MVEALQTSMTSSSDSGGGLCGFRWGLGGLVLVGSRKLSRVRLTSRMVNPGGVNFTQGCAKMVW